MSGLVQRVRLEGSFDNMRGGTQRVFVVNGGQHRRMPTPSQEFYGAIIQYVGLTNDSYTRGYFYECVGGPTYSGTVTFEAASESETVIACTGAQLASLVQEFSSANPADIVSGSMSYDEAGGLWIFVGQNSDDEVIARFQLYQEDFEDAGFTFTGTPEDGDVAEFESSISATAGDFAWQQIDVQP